MFFFFILALFNLATWIIHLWTIAAGVSLIISAIATARLANGRSDAIASNSDGDFGSEPEMTSDLS